MADDAAVVTSFGRAGTRTARIDAPGVGLETGDLLIYTVTVSGAAATFGFGCEHRKILSAATLDGGQPRREYQWEYVPHDPRDSVVLLLQFLAAVKYVVRVDRISAAGALRETLRDADYESQDPEDRCPDNLMVFQVQEA